MSSTSITGSLTVLSRLTARFRGQAGAGRRLSLGRQLLLQLALLLIAFTVLFPILWIFSLSLDPRNISRPTELHLIPPGASVEAYTSVLQRPTNNPISFGALALNSFRLSAGVAVVSVLVGVLAAYAFSRFQFRGRGALMISVLTVLMLPAIATLPALYVLLNRVQFLNPQTGKLIFNLRDSLWGVGLAIVSTQLPFAIWNLKGFLDTIPRELEEAALIDGASANTVFTQIIMPLAVPALAVTGFLSFMGTWTEFAISWQFLNQVKDHTLIMELYNMIGQYADSTPWSKFAAMAILVALPVSAVYLSLQRYIVSGLTIGSVKG
jgi:arabinogalactan oligomer/maltooligosaccharide transport system permease protein